MDRLNRVMGGLFGVACGDALGGTLEFMTVDEIAGKYGYLRNIIGGGYGNLVPGEVSDDTMMTIAVAEGILDNPADPIEDIGRHFIKWFDSRPRGIGRIVRFALGEYKRTNDWQKAALYAHRTANGMSAGNGSLMRCLPAALYYDDADKMCKVTAAQSLLTHYDKQAADACLFYNLMAYDYMHEKQKTDVINEHIKKYPEYKCVFGMSKEELKPTGYVFDTLVCVLWCFINTASFEEAVCEAANLGGDADTIAAITGGMAGVYYGYDSIPGRWKGKISVKERLISVSKRFVIAYNEMNGINFT